jgi:hypothetical protein
MVANRHLFLIQQSMQVFGQGIARIGSIQLVRAKLTTMIKNESIDIKNIKAWYWIRKALNP